MIQKSRLYAVIKIKFFDFLVLMWTLIYIFILAKKQPFSLTFNSDEWEFSMMENGGTAPVKMNKGFQLVYIQNSNNC